MKSDGSKEPGFVRYNVLLWADILVAYALFVMQHYLTDVWKLSFTHAAGILNIWGGISKVLPVFFLFFVDTILGNFKMLLISSISYSVGTCLLTMSIPPLLANATGTCKQYEPECIGQTQKVLFYTGLALIAIGGAGNLVSLKPFFKALPNNSHTSTIDFLRAQGFVIVALMPIIGAIALPYIKPWTVRFGVPAICTVIATLFFTTGWCGPLKYTKYKRKPDGSPITNVCRVYVAAASKMCNSYPLDAKKYHKNDVNETLNPTRFLRCLEKAAIIPDGMDPKENKWRVCSVAEVEEAKIAVGMVPMWMTFVVCGIVSSIANTYFVEQAKNMNRHVGKWKVPPQILLLVFNFAKGLFGMLAALVLKKTTIKDETPEEYKNRVTATNSTYKKVAPAIGIGLGMVFSILCCITAAKIEKRRLGVITSHGLLDKPDEDIPMSMFWLLFQFILLAGLDSFLEISVSEFYTHQSPGSMENYLEYFTKGVSGLGFIFSTLCVYVVGKVSEKGGKPSWFQYTLNKSRLDRYYWVLAGLSAVNLFVYIFVACIYRYKDLEAKNESNSSIGGGGGEDGQGNLELGMINHPCKVGMVYDKPTPVILRREELGSDKPSRRSVVPRYQTEGYLSEGKMDLSQHEIEQYLDPVQSSGVQDQDVGMMLTSIGSSSAAVELQKRSDVATLVEKTGSEPMATSESMGSAEIRKEAASDVHAALISRSNSASISEDQSEQQPAAEDESANLEDSKGKMPGNMPTSISALESMQTVESESFGEIQEVRETTTISGAENLYSAQRDIVSTLKNERSRHHEERRSIATEFVHKEKHYLVSVKKDHIKLELDHQIILIEDIQSPTQPESTTFKPVLNLAEQNLRELPEKSDYLDSFVLFLQRNNQLTLIHSSIFDSMPNLRFLDLSDTRIRILPSSLYMLLKLKVLILSNCAGLENLSSDIGNLNQVEVLDLSGTTELYSLPDETGQLVLLRHMKLSFYGPDDESEFDYLPSQLVSPSILSELKKLRALSITVHPDDHRWIDIASRVVQEVSKLEMLNYLQFYFPKVEIFEEYIKTNKHALTKFTFTVGHNVKRIVSRVPVEVELLFDQQDKCLRFVNCDKVSQLIKTALIQVTAFYLDHHTEIQRLSEFDISNFRALKFCVVRECPNIQAIMDGKAAEGAFPCLEYLGLYYLWELKHIWKPPSPPGRLKRILTTPAPSGHFKALKCLVVITCPKLQFILWESMLQCLSNLEELVVKDCEKLQKIIKEEKKKSKYDDVILPGLRKLELHYLPDLVSLGNGLRLSEEKVNVHGCPKLIL